MSDSEKLEVSNSDRHLPVMLAEVLQGLLVKADGVYLDGTFGAGGYTKGILASGAKIIALDRDENAIEDGQKMVDEFGGQLSLIHTKFSKMADFVELGSLDGVVLDIGVSSMQIDEAERGFSFQKDGPLDMRMSRNGVSAADVVNTLKSSDLTRIFGFLGEEKKAGRIARAIEKHREIEPFSTTLQLAKLISNVVPRRAKDKIHPATRVFQALRIYVNNELGELIEALCAAERCLKPGGRLVVVSFHSLEDRIVKRFVQARIGKASGSRHLPAVSIEKATFIVPGKAHISASDDELSVNPRSRSAKLRCAERTSERAKDVDLSIFNLPNLVSLNKIGAPHS